MLCLQVCNKHVIRIMVLLEICLQLKAESLSSQTSETDLTMSGNTTACFNCSLEANEMKSSKANCSNSRGWNLKGSDWGCCGNYDGCCTFASIICYLHDAVCKCCDIGGTFCGPTCKPELACQSSAALSHQNETEVYRNVSSAKSVNDEQLNVENYEDIGNNTELKNNASRNYFPRGRATSSIDELHFQNGDYGEDGSGDAE